MSNDPFKNFESKPASQKTTDEIIKTSLSVINPKLIAVSIKYGLIFIVSIFFSLLVCPQRGTALFNNNFYFFQHMLHQSEILCGLYCGIVFFTTTHLLTFLLLNHFERLKILKDLSFIPVLFISGFFAFSMTSIFSTLSISINYNISWVFIVIVSYKVLNKVYLKYL